MKVLKDGVGSQKNSDQFSITFFWVANLQKSIDTFEIEIRTRHLSAEPKITQKIEVKMN